MQPKELALLVRKLVDDKKGEDPKVLDISRQTTIAHYFVITHANSDPHLRAIAYHVSDTLKEKKLPVWHLEGMDGPWVILDLGAVILHVFRRETREFYALERLWGDAKILE